jgi:hypothetical protein
MRENSLAQPTVEVIAGADAARSTAATLFASSVPQREAAMARVCVPGLSFW